MGLRQRGCAGSTELPTQVMLSLVKLETRLLGSEDPGDEDIRAGTLGSCYLSVLIHQAVRETIRKQGLPRPLCVMAGTSGIYPFFDAPVMSSERAVLFRASPR